MVFWGKDCSCDGRGLWLLLKQEQPVRWTGRHHVGPKWTIGRMKQPGLLIRLMHGCQRIRRHGEVRRAGQHRQVGR